MVKGITGNEYHGRRGDKARCLRIETSQPIEGTDNHDAGLVHHMGMNHGGMTHGIHARNLLAQVDVFADQLTLTNLLC